MIRLVWNELQVYCESVKSVYCESVKSVLYGFIMLYIGQSSYIIQYVD